MGKTAEIHSSEDNLTTKTSTPETACYHCGENLEKEVIHFEDHSFCCQGCKMVYQVLSGAGLQDYYEIEEKPGQRMAGKGSQNRFAYLDDPETARQLLDFTDGQVAKVTFYVPQIHCTSCIWLLEKLHQLEPGILSSRVNFLKKEVYITYDEQQHSLKEVVQALSRIGYEPLINFDSLHKKDKSGQHKKSNQYAYKLGVTGFCLGNIMLASFPEYLGISKSDQSFIDLFGYLNIGLSLPVFFYGASGYLRSAWEAIRHKGVNIDVPISLGILVLFFRSVYEILSQTGAGYLDSMASLVFLLLVGKWFQEKTFENISFERDYKSYFPIAVTVKEGSVEVSKPLSKVKSGDCLLLRSGELIPADAVLIKGEASIDYSFVTGESAEILKNPGEQLFAGGRQKGGLIEIELVKEVSQSYLTRLWNEDEKQGSSKKNLSTITDRLSRNFTYTIITVATLGGAYWYFTSGAEAAINIFTAVLIIACPCALALTVPFTLGNAMRLLARKQVYAKGTEVIERLTSINHIVFDKTGTITSAEKEQTQWQGESLSDKDKTVIASLVRQSTHPVSQKVFKVLHAESSDWQSIRDFKEIAGEGICGKVDQLEIRVGKRSFVTAEEETSGSGKRNFQTEAHISLGGKYLGYFTFKQQFRSGVESLMKTLKNHYQLSLLSGDNEGERSAIESLFEQKERLMFQQSPADKKNYIQRLQQKGERVLMIGDGLNDAGALLQSDVSISVAEDVHQFSPACDIIVGASQVPNLEKVINYTKSSLNVVRGGFALSLSYNIVGVTLALKGMISPLLAAVLMPLSSVTAVGFGMIMTYFLFKKFWK